MIRLRNILPLLLAVILLGGCRSARTVKKERVTPETDLLIAELVKEPPVSELTASLSMSLNGTRVSGQLPDGVTISYSFAKRSLGFENIVENYGAVTDFQTAEPPVLARHIPVT